MKRCLLPAGILVALLALPVGASWLAALLHRDGWANAFQLLVLVILAMGIRRRWPSRPPVLRPNAAGASLLILFGLAMLAAALLAVKAALWSAWLLLLAAFVLALFGFSFLRERLPLLAFSFFLLPQLPLDAQTTISLPLQLLSTQLTAGLAGLFIPIAAQGNIFTINGSAFEVTVPCSGLHTWIGFLFAGLLWLVFERATPARLLAVFIAAPLLALATNTLRLFITALVAFHVSPDAAMSAHTNLEFVLFPLGLAALWLLPLRSRPARLPAGEAGDDPMGELPAADRAKEATASESAEPASTERKQPSAGAPGGITAPQRAYLSGVCGWLLLLNIGVWTLQAAPERPTMPALPVPVALSGWEGQSIPHTREELAILAPARLISRSYYANLAASPGKGAHDAIWLNVIESGSMGAMHNFHDSLVASGARPRILGARLLQTGKGVLRASLLEIDCADQLPCHLLLWYQWPNGSAENRWRWYLDVLKLRLARKAPTWQLVEVAAPVPRPDSAASRARGLQRLETFARALYEASQP